jgi:hypothetical protein
VNGIHKGETKYTSGRLVFSQPGGAMRGLIADRTMLYW